MFTNNIMSNRGLIKIKNGTAAAMAVEGGQASPVPDANDRAGWSYTKVPGAMFPDDKINYFFWGGSTQNMKIKDLKSLFCLGSIDAWTKTASEMFFFIIYTKPKGDGSDQAAWYHSRHAYTLDINNQVIQPMEKCLFYALAEPLKDFDGARKIPLKNRIDTGIYNQENELLYCTLHSDSAATDMSCLVQHMGCDFFKNHFHAVERVVDVKCIT